MRNSSEESKKSFRRDTAKRYRIQLLEPTEDITKYVDPKSMKIDGMLLSSSNLSFAEINAERISFSILKQIDDLAGRRFKIDIISESQHAERICRGFITYTTKKQNSTRMQVTAYDYLKYADRDVSEWYSNLEFPISMKAFRKSLMEYVGLEDSNAELINDDVMLDRTIEPRSLGGIKVLEAIADINAVFIHAGGNGLINYISLKTNQSEVIPENLFHGMKAFEKKNYVTKKITGVHIRAKEGDIGGSFGTGTNAYIVNDNLLLYGKSTEELNAISERIYEEIKDIQYVPCSLEVKYQPFLELGDKIRIGEEGIESYILNRTISGYGSVISKYEAPGLEKIEEEFGIQYDIEQVKGKTNVLERDVEHLASTITDVEADMESRIKQTASTIMMEVERLQSEINGEIDIYFSDEVPNLNNYPAVDWSINLQIPFKLDENAVFKRYTDEIYKKHMTAVCYVRSTGDSYRFSKNEDGTFSWNIVANTELTAILEQISSLTIEADKITQSVRDVRIELQNGYYTKSENDAKMQIMSDNITATVSQKYLTKTEGEDIQGELESKIEQTASGIIQSVSNTYQTKSDAKTMKNELNSSIQQTAESIKSSVSNTYETKSAAGTMKKELISTINQTASSITSTVSNTYETKQNAKTTRESMQSQISQNAQSITTKVTKGNVSSQISQEAGSISISANRISINSDNLKISSYGFMEALYPTFYSVEADVAHITTKSDKTYASLILERKSDSKSRIEFNYQEASYDWIIRNHYLRMFKSNTDSGLFYTGNSISATSASLNINSISCNRNASVGSLDVYGEKNRCIQTEDYGIIKMAACESPDPRFVMYGSGECDEYGICYVDIDDRFRAVSNTDVEYQFLFSQTSIKKIEWVEKTNLYAIVHGESGATFDFEISAKQLGYENNNFEIADKKYEYNDIDEYDEIFEDELIRNEEEYMEEYYRNMEG